MKQKDPLCGLELSLRAETTKHALVVRDTFSFPESDHALLFDLQSRCLRPDSFTGAFGRSGGDLCILHRGNFTARGKIPKNFMRAPF